MDDLLGANQIISIQNKTQITEIGLTPQFVFPNRLWYVPYLNKIFSTDITLRYILNLPHGHVSYSTGHGL